MDVRFGKLGTKLPKFAWRASPEYVDFYMRNFENKYFSDNLSKNMLKLPVPTHLPNKLIFKTKSFNRIFKKI